jgi:hypothetical protein
LRARTSDAHPPRFEQREGQRRLVDDLEPHLAGGASDDAEAASSFREFKSLPFVFTISITCLRLILPTLFLFGSFDPGGDVRRLLQKTAAAGSS